MSIDAGFPLPRFVRGYACLTADEIALASKDIDPARPSGSVAAGRTGAAAARVDAAPTVALDGGTRILSYAPGAVRTAAIDTGAILSLEA